MGLSFDSKGGLYLADHVNNRIRYVSGGNVSTVAGDGKTGAKNGPAATATFNSPWDVTVGSGGRVYVADSKNNMLRVIQSGQVHTLAGDGTTGFLDGSALSARFSSISGVVAEASGKVFIADYHNHRIRLYTPCCSP
jgi:hypothetical protein